MSVCLPNTIRVQAGRRKRILKAKQAGDEGIPPVTPAARDFWVDVSNETRMGQYLTRVERRLLSPILRGRTGRCLDIGCGSGRFSFLAVEEGLDVIGLDISELPLSKLRSKGNEVSAVLASAASLPFRDSLFGTIMAIEVADYLPLAAFLEDCHRVMAAGGVLCFTLSNRKSWKRYLYRIARPQGKYYQFSPDQVTEELRKSGFEVRQTCGFNWQPLARNSDSRLVDVFGWLERRLGLNRLITFSPWMFVVAVKR